MTTYRYKIHRKYEHNIALSPRIKCKEIQKILHVEENNEFPEGNV
jgi:hypothetical protein